MILSNAQQEIPTVNSDEIQSVALRSEMLHTGLFPAPITPAYRSESRTPDLRISRGGTGAVHTRVTSVDYLYVPKAHVVFQPRPRLHALASLTPSLIAPAQIPKLLTLMSADSHAVHLRDIPIGQRYLIFSQQSGLEGRPELVTCITIAFNNTAGGVTQKGTQRLDRFW